MHPSVSIFLINDNVRALICNYDPDGVSSKVNTPFKTMDPDLKVGDFVVVPTKTRHGLTVVKVEEIDVDLDFDAGVEVKWIVSKVDMTDYDELVAQEATAIKAIRSAELRQKRENLREALFKDHMDELRALPISTVNGDKKE